MPTNLTHIRLSVAASVLSHGTTPCFSTTSNGKTWGSVSPSDVGKASGVNSTMQRFGSAFAIAVASAVFAANGQLGTAAAFTAGFRPALTVVAAMSLLGALAALAISHQPPAARVSVQTAAVAE